MGSRWAPEETAMMSEEECGDLREALAKAQDEIADLKAALAKESAHAHRLDALVESRTKERDELEDDKNSLEREIESMEDKAADRITETESDLEWCFHKMLDLGFDGGDIRPRLDSFGVEIFDKVSVTRACPPNERIAGWAFDHFVSVCNRLRLNQRDYLP